MERSIKRILVPMDFSQEAVCAMEVAVGIARKSGAEILLPHIIEIPGHFYHSTGKFDLMDSENMYVKQLMMHFNERMKELKKEKGFDGIKMEHQIEIGSAFPGLKKIILHSKADLVVMGSKGAGGIEELYLGSTSQRMIRHSNCPILIIKNKVNVDEIHDIVFATNCTQTPYYVTIELQTLASLLGANLHLLQVNTKSNWRSHREIETEIRDFAEQHKIEDYSVEIYDDDTALEGIIHYSEDYNTDMIAIMTHGRTGMSHLISGSIADKIAGHSVLPVWTCGFNHTTYA